jgi:hypothetical protein
MTMTSSSWRSRSAIEGRDTEPAQSPSLLQPSATRRVIPDGGARRSVDAWLSTLAMVNRECGKLMARPTPTCS